MPKIFATTKEKYYLSPEGFTSLKSKIQLLRASRLELIQNLRQLKDQRSDSLSAEDSAYIQTLDSLHNLELDIEKSEHILAHAKVLDNKKKHSKVTLGSRVKLKTASHEIEYMIVQSLEADPSKGKISDKSPVGQQLLGKRLRDYITLKHERKQKPIMLRLVNIS